MKAGVGEGILHVQGHRVKPPSPAEHHHVQSSGSPPHPSLQAFVSLS